MTFTHVDLNLPRLERVTIDGVRYYEIPEGDGQLHKLVSITSVISHFNREKFAGWRKKVGDAEADRISKRATSRGTDLHTLVEEHLLNMSHLSNVLPISEMLFQRTVPTLKRINNIHALEGALYSTYLGVAGTVDCIAEFDGELAVIDFKTSKQPKPRDWIEDYFVQCCAYACMLHEMTGINVKKFVIIMACENGEVEVYEEYDLAKYLKLLVKYIKNFVETKTAAYT
jgi:CRISPR/Cas system-associated exonuclease Cas4 (RecB family)